MSYVIKKPMEDICLNGPEYLLDGPDGAIMEFPTEQEARTFIAMAMFEGDEDAIDDSFVEIEEYAAP